jgi:hypothetical protein
MTYRDKFREKSAKRISEVLIQRGIANDDAIKWSMTRAYKYSHPTIGIFRTFYSALTAHLNHRRDTQAQAQPTFNREHAPEELLPALKHAADLPIPPRKRARKSALPLQSRA